MYVGKEVVCQCAGLVIVSRCAVLTLIRHVVTGCGGNGPQVSSADT
jgi:hypothetical protein